MSNLARTERLRLVDAAHRAGEEAPTLCEGWTTRDLATHLVIRERHPVAALGIFAPKFEGKREDQEKAYAKMPYSQLLGLVAAPPRWTPGGWPGIESVMNTAEYVVHHEDIRRAAIEWIPRRLSLPENRAVWAACRTALLPFSAKAKGRVEIVSPGFGQRSAGRLARGTKGNADGTTRATITGEPVEILLYLMGREKYALVDVKRQSHQA